MDFRLVNPSRDRDRLRGFLSTTDPEDYLLEELDEWVLEGRLWVEEDRGEWVAFGRLHDLGDREGWLSGMRVVPARREQGLGGKLVEALLADARSIGLRDVRAAIEDGNVASRRLFERFGFRPAVVMTLRRGFARSDAVDLLHRAAPDERPDGPVGWLPARTGRVDLLPASDGGRFGEWRPALLSRWAREGKLYVGPRLAAAVQVDWWKEPRTLWVNPLVGEPAVLFPAISALAHTLGHEEWQAFLPSLETFRAQYVTLGLVPHPAWGDRVLLYERLDPTSTRL